MSQKNPTVMESLEAMKPRQINQIFKQPMVGSQ